MMLATVPRAGPAAASAAMMAHGPQCVTVAGLGIQAQPDSDAQSRGGNHRRPPTVT